MFLPTTATDGMTASPAPSSWRRISTGDDTVAVAERAALGTTARLAVWPPENLGAALGAVDSVLSALDRQASRFREDSEISWVHRSGGGRFMLSNGFAEAVSVALEAARWTGGLVDPTVGDALISLGYDRDFAAIDPEQARPAGAPVPAPGWQAVRLEGPMLSLPDGVRLDLGATAKGLGSDRAVRAAMKASGQAGGVLVSLGGDIAVAGQSPLDGWPILVADRPDDPASSQTQNVRLASGAIATSFDHLPPMAAGGTGTSSHRGSPDRASHRWALADGERGGGHVRGRQRRLHSRCRRRRAGRGMASPRRPACPARRPRRAGALRRWLARRRRRPHRRLAGESCISRSKTGRLAVSAAP